jgi:hypothetical protein
MAFGSMVKECKISSNVGFEVRKERSNQSLTKVRRWTFVAYAVLCLALRSLEFGEASIGLFTSARAAADDNSQSQKCIARFSEFVRKLDKLIKASLIPSIQYIAYWMHIFR